MTLDEKDIICHSVHVCFSHTFWHPFKGKANTITHCWHTGMTFHPIQPSGLAPFNTSYISASTQSLVVIGLLKITIMRKWLISKIYNFHTMKHVDKCIVYLLPQEVEFCHLPHTSGHIFKASLWYRAAGYQLERINYREVD